MTHRNFVDRDGRQWEAWDVFPLGDRRTLDRRQVTERGRLIERRGGTERRQRHHGRSPLVRTGYGTGWLCFAHGDERRRHAPVPEGWESWDDARLDMCCRQATPVVRRVAS